MIATRRETLGEERRGGRERGADGDQQQRPQVVSARPEEGSHQHRRGRAEDDPPDLRRATLRALGNRRPVGRPVCLRRRHVLADRAGHRPQNSGYKVTGAAVWPIVISSAVIASSNVSAGTHQARLITGYATNTPDNRNK